MKRDSDKVDEVDYEDEDELTDIEHDQSVNDIYLEILGDDGDVDIDAYDEVVIAPGEDVPEGENEVGG